MAEIRFLRGWSESELAQRLLDVPALPSGVPEGVTDLRPETGWNHVLSHGRIGEEEPGPPLPSGAFAHARRLVERFSFSDRRIVVGHFDRESVLQGRSFLLELKSLGLRFLCPARVTAVRDETTEGKSFFGYRYDTLRGHIERGREWFLLTKDHRSGEISFRIEAGWLPGDFPSWWSRLGFHLVGRRYQRAWHRLAYAHLRASLRQWDAQEHGARGRAQVHPGLADAPVQVIGQKAHKPRRLAVEEEHSA